MAMWHCPHCGAPQAEAARCWVCRRSSTTCSTCRHFRTSLAAELGYCAKDRRRAPLTGRELKACWEEGARTAQPRFGAGAPASDAAPLSGRAVAAVRGRGGPLDRPDPMRLRGFVPLDELTPSPAPVPAADMPSEDAAPALPPALLPDPSEGWDARPTLFGEAER